MVVQILVGTVLIATTIIVSMILVALAIRFLAKHGAWLSRGNPLVKSSFALTGVTIWLIFVLTLTMWIWALAFYGLGLFDNLETALYFSMVAFTTLGFGDVTLPESWRLLSGFVAANGLILFGLSTAFLIELLSRLRQSQTK